MICQCGKRFVEACHNDFPTLCYPCVIVAFREHNRAWSQWLATLAVDERIDYFNNGPYTLQQVKEMMFKTKDEAI